MKNEEDEAFDELAKRQGAWGGGFKAKQAMAIDKQKEYDPCLGCIIGTVCRTPKCGRLKLPFDHPLRNAQPVQEPVAYLLAGPYEKRPFADISAAQSYCNGLNKGFGEDVYIVSPLYTAPPQPTQEPVAWAIYDKRGGSKSLHWPENHSPDGDVTKFDAVPLYTTPPLPAQEPAFGWIKQSELAQARRYGGSVNLWLEKHDCDFPLYTAPPQPVPEPVARVNDDGFIVETGLDLAPGVLLYTTAPLLVQEKNT